MHTEYKPRQAAYQIWYYLILYKLDVYEDKYVITVPCINRTIVVNKKDIERFYDNLLYTGYSLPVSCRHGIKRILAKYVDCLKYKESKTELVNVIKKIKKRLYNENYTR